MFTFHAHFPVGVELSSSPGWGGYIPELDGFVTLDLIPSTQKCSVSIISAHVKSHSSPNEGRKRVVFVFICKTNDACYLKRSSGGMFET